MGTLSFERIFSENWEGREIEADPREGAKQMQNLQKGATYPMGSSAEPSDPQQHQKEAKIKARSPLSFQRFWKHRRWR